MTNDTTIPPLKRCTKCNEEKPIELFHRNANAKDGLTYRCKDCIAEYQKAHKEQHNINCRKHYERHTEKILASHREWRQRNPEKAKAFSRSWAERNPDYYRDWRHANADYLKQKKKQYRQENASVILERWRLYCEKYPEDVAARKRRWGDANPAKVKASHHRRRTRIKGNGGYFTYKELEHIAHIQAGKCCYCGRVGLPLSIDHIIPVTQGGPSDIWNLALCCRSCNSSKQDRTLEQWTDRWYLRPLKDELI